MMRPRQALSLSAPVLVIIGIYWLGLKSGETVQRNRVNTETVSVHQHVDFVAHGHSTGRTRDTDISRTRKDQTKKHESSKRNTTETSDRLSPKQTVAAVAAVATTAAAVRAATAPTGSMEQHKAPLYTVPPFVRANETLDALATDEAEDRFFDSVAKRHVECQQRKRMGSALDGGWDICLDPPFHPDAGCLVYSFGINNDFSFDDAMAETFNCSVFCFDPSMEAKDHRRSPHVWFYQLGLGEVNGVNGDGWPLETFGTIVDRLGHRDSIIDVLKIDIEYSEWGAFKTMLKDGGTRLTKVKQLVFEIHTPALMYMKTTTQQYFDMYETLAGLERLGFRRFHFHLNPWGSYVTVRNKKRGCCYELYYMNMSFRG